MLDIPNLCRDKWLETTGRTLNPCECVTAFSKEFDIDKLNRTLCHYRFRESEGDNGCMQLEKWYF